MPAQRINERAWNLLLSIIIGDGFSKKPSPMRSAQGFKRIGIKARTSDACEDRVEYVPRQNALLRRRGPQLGRGV